MLSYEGARAAEPPLPSLFYFNFYFNFYFYFYFNGFFRFSKKPFGFRSI